jgi:hypothetical protein
MCKDCGCNKNEELQRESAVDRNVVTLSSLNGDVK